MPQWRGETAAVERIGLGHQGNLLVILTLDKHPVGGGGTGRFCFLFVCYRFVCFDVVLRG